MPTQTTLTGITTPAAEASLAVKMAPIPGLRQISWFGSGRDGINTNRLTSGLALAPLGAPVIYGDNYVRLGQNGTPATAVPVIVGGEITSYTVTAGGSGFVAPPAVNIIGNGSGAVGTAVIEGGVVVSITPTAVGSGYTDGLVTVSLRGGNMAALDTQIVRDAARLAAGWTWFCVGRTQSSGQPSVMIGDGGGVPAFQMVSQNANLFVSSTPTIELLQNGGSSAPKIRIQASTPLTNYHAMAVTYSGGAAGTFNLYNLTDGQTGTPWVASNTLVTAQSVHIGPNGTSGAPEGLFSTITDVCMDFIADGAISLVNLQSHYASIKSYLALRSITC